MFVLLIDKNRKIDEKWIDFDSEFQCIDHLYVLFILIRFGTKFYKTCMKKIKFENMYLYKLISHFAGSDI